jgi:hypothetical protein
MKTDIQAQIFSETQNMSTPELLDYFNQNKAFPQELPDIHQIQYRLGERDEQGAGIYFCPLYFRRKREKAGLFGGD